MHLTKEDMEELKRWIDERIKGSEDYMLEKLGALKVTWELQQRIDYLERELEKKEGKNGSE